MSFKYPIFSSGQYCYNFKLIFQGCFTPPPSCPHKSFFNTHFILELEGAGDLKINGEGGEGQLFVESHVLVRAPGSSRNRDFCSVSHGPDTDGREVIFGLKFLNNAHVNLK